MLDHTKDAFAPPHLTGNVPGERPELLQPSSSRQTTARKQRGRVAGRAIREFGLGPGCAIQTTLGARSGLACQRACPNVKSGALSRAEARSHLSRFLVPEPGGAWLGPLWPNRGAGFGPQRVAFRSSPQPSPGAYKRSSMEPLDSLCRLISRLSSLHFAPCLAIVDCQNALLLL